MPRRLTRWTDPREDGDNPLERAALIRDADVLTMVNRALTAG